MHVKDRAICLRAVNYSDTSQVITLLCREHGKLGAMAKGSRRPKNAFDGPIEVFSCGSVVLVVKDSGGQLAALTEFHQEPRFRQLTKRLAALHAALFGAELTEAFLEEHDPHPALFDKFLKFLETVQDSASDSLVWAWLILYQLRLLEETGIAPVWDQCTNCGTSLTSSDSPPARGLHPTDKSNSPPVKGESGAAGRGYHSAVYFSSRNNGLLCSACEGTFVEKRAIDWKIVEILQQPSRLPKTDIETLKQTEALLIYHLTELLHKRPKMAKYFS
ncbi:MAG: DNA repair protein RecO [Planctomycetaceae bacterium]|nr:DNA repair protein RecO [Planctomycetaceae bacterium]